MLSLNKGRKDTERREDTWRSPDVAWLHGQGCALENGTCIFHLEPKIDTPCSHCNSWSFVFRLHDCRFWDDLHDLIKTASRLSKGEDEFKLNLLALVLNMKSSEQTDGFLSAVHFWNLAQLLSPDFPFYLILPMTDCTLFKLPVTFPLCELLYFKILIKAEPPVISWFPAIAEAAADMKEGVTSLSWGQGVKLDNRLFVCGFSVWFPDLSMRPKGCECCTPGHQWLRSQGFTGPRTGIS